MKIAEWWNTTNQVQRDYMMAKMLVEFTKAQQAEIERQYIADNGIANPDGSIPELIYCIEDETAFEKANKECSAIIAAAGLEEEMNTASAALQAAEDKLIEYGLSIVPAKTREILQKAVKENAYTRFKVIDLAFRLDVSTVVEGVSFEII